MVFLHTNTQNLESSNMPLATCTEMSIQYFAIHATTFIQDWNLILLSASEHFYKIKNQVECIKLEKKMDSSQ